MAIVENLTACLIIHGLAGNLDEIEPLYNYLTSRNIHSRMFLLHGHGKTNKELAESNYMQWLSSAEKELLQLKKEYLKIILVGFSMGGLIAVNLINIHGADGVVFINTPVYYWDIKRIVKNLASDFKSYFSNYLKKSTDKPLKTLLQFVILLNKTKKLFGNVTAKTLILQALDDDTVHHKSADCIFSKVKGEKSIKFYDKGGHTILQSTCGELICSDVHEFVARL